MSNATVETAMEVLKFLENLTTDQSRLFLVLSQVFTADWEKLYGERTLRPILYVVEFGLKLNPRFASGIRLYLEGNVSLPNGDIRSDRQILLSNSLRCPSQPSLMLSNHLNSMIPF